MIRKLSLAAALAVAAMSARPALADEQSQAIYDKVSPSLVAVSFHYAGETQQQDFIIPGIVVSDTGLVMIPMFVFERIPDDQLTHFKIIIPRLDRDNQEVDAVFQGRDEPGGVAFVKAVAPGETVDHSTDKKEKTDDAKPKADHDKPDAGDDMGDGKKAEKVEPKKKADDAKPDADQDDDKKADADKAAPEKAQKEESKPAKAPAEPVKWMPLSFTTDKPTVGDSIYSVGMLPKSGGYHTFLTKSMVAADLRGPVKTMMVSGGGLGSSFAPVLNSDGKAVGLVTVSSYAELMLDDTKSPQARAMAQLTTNRYFELSSEFSDCIGDPPTPGHPVALPFTGLMQMSGLGKNDAALFGLNDKVAIQISDVLPGSVADKAGLKSKEVITELDGKPLERGDMPDEAVGIFERKVEHKKPGDVITLTVLDASGKKARQVKLTLAEYPERDFMAKRYFSEDDIGIGVREMVPLDRHYLRLKKDQKDGVLVTVLKPGGSAASANVRLGDMITKINDEPVTSLEVFKSSYEGLRKDHEHDAIVLQVHRVDGTDETIRIEPPQ